MQDEIKEDGGGKQKKGPGDERFQRNDSRLEFRRANLMINVLECLSVWCSSEGGNE